MLWFTDQKIKTVKDMYDYAVENQEELLSGFTSTQSVLYDFWANYLTNNELYDRAFCTKYKNFFYFDQDGSETIEDVFDRFVQAVEDFLTLNDKKYTELFKIELMTVPDNSVLNDYKIVETKEGEKTVEREYVSGDRTDRNSVTTGARTDTTTNQTMAYNSSAFVDASKSTDVKGEEDDSSAFEKGEQTDNESVSEDTGHTITTTGIKGSPYENMQKYIEAWDGYSFYTMVFRDIAKELLLL